MNVDLLYMGVHRCHIHVARSRRARGARGLDRLRRALAGLEPQQALELLLDKTRETSSNV
jgi:hypothetical protein